MTARYLALLSVAGVGDGAGLESKNENMKPTFSRCSDNLSAGSKQASMSESIIQQWKPNTMLASLLTHDEFIITSLASPT